MAAGFLPFMAASKFRTFKNLYPGPQFFLCSIAIKIRFGAGSKEASSPTASIDSSHSPAPNLVAGPGSNWCFLGYEASEPPYCSIPASNQSQLLVLGRNLGRSAIILSGSRKVTSLLRSTLCQRVKNSGS